MIVLWDQDDVLADWHSRALDGMRARPGIDHLADRVTTTFDMFHGLDPAESVLMREMLDEAGFYRDLRPVPGAIEALLATAEQHDVFIVTTPWMTHGQHTSPTEKTLWVEEHLGPEWVGRLILTRDKTLVHGDVLIDDRDVIRGVRDPDWTRIFVDMPWNRQAMETSTTARLLRTHHGFENLPVLLEWVQHVREDASGHRRPGEVLLDCVTCESFLGRTAGERTVAPKRVTGVSQA